MTVYNRGLTRLAAIATADLRWMLLQGTGYTFDRDDDFVDDLTPGSNEVSSSGRETLTGGALAVDDTTNRAVCSADNPDFGTLTAGDPVTAAVLYEFVTDDSDSTLVAYFAFDEIDSGDLDPFVVNLAGGVVAYFDEA